MRVAAEKVNNYTYPEVERGLAEALSHLGGLASHVESGERVLIKPNMLEGLPPEKAVTTNPLIVRAVIREVKKAGAVPFVGDSPGTTSTFKAAEKCGILTVCQEEGAELLPFDATAEMPFPDGLTVKKFVLAKPLTQVDKVISVAKMKTHTFMGVTGAAKNLFGLIVGMQKAQFHLRLQERREFAGMLIDLAKLVKPVLSIVDGVVGMEGNGPRNGQPIEAGVVLAGTNCFAVDVVMAAMMGFSPASLPLTSMAIEQGLTPELSGIELVGSAKDVRIKFAGPRTLMSLTDRIPKWVAEFGRNQFTARPEIGEACVGCGRCAAHCPPKAMTISDGKVHVDYSKCIRCYCCQELCPENAVHLEEGQLLKLARRFI